MVNTINETLHPCVHFFSHANQMTTVLLYFILTLVWDSTGHEAKVNTVALKSLSNHWAMVWGNTSYYLCQLLQSIVVKVTKRTDSAVFRLELPIVDPIHFTLHHCGLYVHPHAQSLAGAARCARDRKQW